MDIHEQKEKIEVAVKAFKKSFSQEFGIEVLVVVKNTNNVFPTLSLEKLEKLINIIYYNKYPENYPHGINTRKRHFDLINHRYCFYKIALDMGYTQAFSGAHLGFDHATVLYANNRVLELLVMKDTLTTFNLYIIYAELEKKYGLNAYIQSDDSAECKP